MDGSPVHVSGGGGQRGGQRQEVSDNGGQQSFVLDKFGCTAKRVSRDSGQNSQNIDDGCLAARTKDVQNIGQPVHNIHSKQTQNKVGLDNLNIFELWDLFLKLFVGRYLNLGRK
jgi:hypothetical protein